MPRASRHDLNYQSPRLSRAAMPHTSPPLFFFNDTATTEIYTLSLHDALPILVQDASIIRNRAKIQAAVDNARGLDLRSEEHTSELQSQSNLVCRLLLEKKNTQTASRLLRSTRGRRPGSLLRWPETCGPRLHAL